MHKSDILIREAEPRDAKKLNHYIREVYATSDHLITRPEEFRIGAWKQRFWIARKLSNPSEICFLAIIDGEIIGMLDNWVDRRSRVRHITTFAMSVKDDWQAQGIGTRLLGKFIGWASEHPRLEKIELHVHADNERALKLYEKMGFTFEGRRRNAIKYSKERIVDDIIMGLDLASRPSSPIQPGRHPTAGVK